MLALSQIQLVSDKIAVIRHLFLLINLLPKNTCILTPYNPFAFLYHRFIYMLRTSPCPTRLTADGNHLAPGKIHRSVRIYEVRWYKMARHLTPSIREDPSMIARIHPLEFLLCLFTAISCSYLLAKPLLRRSRNFFG